MNREFNRLKDCRFIIHRDDSLSAVAKIFIAVKMFKVSELKNLIVIVSGR